MGSSVRRGVLADWYLDEDELRVVGQIIEAAVWSVTAEEFSVSVAALE